MNALDFAAAAFAVYAVTGLVTVSHLFGPFRQLFRQAAWKILPIQIAGLQIAKHFVKFERFADIKTEAEAMAPILKDDADLDLTTERAIEGYDFIACRMCVGVWVTAALFAWNTPAAYLLGIYGAAYFLATQERE